MVSLQVPHRTSLFRLQTALLKPSSLSPKMAARIIALAISALCLSFESGQSQVAGATAPLNWTGYMNVFDNNGGSKGGYVFGSGWGVADLKTTVSGASNNNLVLQPNFNVWNAADPFWVLNNAGNKFMEANTLYERPISKLAPDAIFAGSVASCTLSNSYKAVAFIKILDPGNGYGLVAQATNALTTSSTNFYLSMNLASYAANPNFLVQAGFTVSGLNANPANSNALGSVNLTVTNVPAAIPGPQINVKVQGLTLGNNATTSLHGPLPGQGAAYVVVVENIGSANLVVSNTVLSNTIANSFSLDTSLSNAIVSPGAVKSFILKTASTNLANFSGALTITSNDDDAADKSFKVNLTTAPVYTSGNFNSPTDNESIGWKTNSNWEGIVSDSSVSASDGSLKISAVSTQGYYPWYYEASKTFASPGSAIVLTNSDLQLRLRASGAVSGITTNMVDVYLESLDLSGIATGHLYLGEAIDQTTFGQGGSDPNYFTPDGIADRVTLLVPQDNAFHEYGGNNLSAIATNSAFNPSAPFFRLVVKMTDREFDLDADNLVEIDSLNLNLAADNSSNFGVANSGFEADSSLGPDELTQKFSVPTGWNQWSQVGGVSKSLVSLGQPVYDQSVTSNSSTVLFTPYAGSNALKIYAQNDYATNGNRLPDPQIGVVYQEWPASAFIGLVPGAAIHAQAAAKVYGVDRLTNGSKFNFGFRYLGADNQPMQNKDQVTTLTQSNITDVWNVLLVNGSVPDGAVKVQLIAEFVQPGASGKGSVYLDDVSVGYGAVETPTPPATNYALVWADEFDGASLNTNNWTPETGGGGWGNQEAQTYTTNPANLRVTNGSLVIQALKSGTNWTSARIKTQGKRSFKYGKIEFRAKLPTGIGPWPAAWMMGANISTAGWPNCGEIDVMEWRGYPTNDANTVGHALHSRLSNGPTPVQPAARSVVTNPSTQFHTYAVVWNSNNMVFSVDGVDKATLTPPAGDAASFQQEHFLLLNMAIGGNYLQGQIATSLANATYEVDYVRVYQDPSVSGVPADTTPPVITVLGNNPFSVPWGGSYSDSGATAFDAGENASVHVATVNPVDPSVPGVYSVTYTAQDSTGNSTNTNRLVNVIMANNGNNVGPDGLTDSLRYAFGATGPGSISRTLLPSNSLTPGTNGTKNLVMTYFARTNENVSLLPWASANLASSNGWTTNGIVVTILSNVATNGTILEKRQATTPATNSQKFLRLRSIFTE